MFAKLFILATAVSATLVSAISISQQCVGALETVVASPDATCLDATALVSLFTQSKNSSIIGPINNWLTGVCGLPPCTNATLAAVVANITNGCSSDLGLNSTDSATLTQTVQTIYPALRQVLCLKDTNTNAFCVTETLTNIQNIAGTLSIDNIGNVTSNIIDMTSIPTNVTCTDCIKAAYNIWATELPSQAAEIAGPLQSQCGASFIDGGKPGDVAEIAAASPSSQASGSALGAVSLLHRGTFTGIAISVLLVVFSAVALLA